MPTRAKAADKPLWVQVMNALNAHPDLRRDIVGSLDGWRIVANAMDEARTGGSRFAKTLDRYGVNSGLRSAVVDSICAAVFKACGRKEETDAMA